MAIGSIVRRVALAIPRVRRFYDYSQTLRSERDELASALANLRRRHDGLSTERDAAVGELDHLKAELIQVGEARDQAETAARLAAADREDLALRLYVLRSDYQRAVSAAEEVRDALWTCERNGHLPVRERADGQAERP